MTFTDGGTLGDSTSSLASSLQEMQTLTAGFTGEIAGATQAMKLMDAQAQRLSRSLGSSLRTAINQLVLGGGNLTDVLRNLALSVASTTLNAALTPVTNGLASAVTSALGFAAGGVFSAGQVRAFARGGVVDRPTVFPMRNGAGLMGEAGPEAVMPLVRGSDGRLGVAAQGGGTSVTINISTPDLESFQRSRGQVAAQLARAVQRGASRL